MGCNWNECWKAKHPLRLVQWRINNVTPSNHETQVMDRDGVTKIDVLRSFLAWRRTTFVAALPILLLSAVLGTIDSFAGGFEGLSGLGTVVLFLPVIAQWIFFGFCIAALCKWNRWRRSAYLLKTGWGVSFVLPLIPAIFPLEHIIDSDVVAQIENGTEEDRATFEGFKIILAIYYVLKILPIVISFPGGSMRAALRVRALLPESSLSSWILVISAPFYSVLILMALVVILQLAGNALLILGSLLLTINPWVYVVFRRLLVTVSTPEVEKKLDILQRCTGISNLVGLILIISYITTSPDIQGFISTRGIVQFALISWSRTIITTVLFGDIFLRMSITNWKSDSARRTSDQGYRIDMLFESLEVSVKKSNPNKQSAFEADSSGSSGSSQHMMVEEVTAAQDESGPDVEVGEGFVMACALVEDVDGDASHSARKAGARVTLDP